MKTTAQVLQQQNDDAERDRSAIALQTTATPAAINTGLGYLAKHASSGTCCGSARTASSSNQRRATQTTKARQRPEGAIHLAPT
jgi:hypothetical protein